MTTSAPSAVPSTVRLGQRITAALHFLRVARAKATAEPTGYHANQELTAELELDTLLVQWPTRRRV